MKNTPLLPPGFNIKSFIEDEGNSNIESIKLVSKIRKKYGEFAPFLIEQLKLNPKAKIKLPSHAGRFCLFTTKSFEQSSSEILAEFKYKRFSGKSILDLTGGLGIDDWAFSRSFKDVISIDSDARLNEIARYNFRQMKIENVKRIDSDAYEFIKQDLHFDMIYVDADRRVNKSGSKTLTLHDSEPSVPKIGKRLFEISNSVLLKISPLVDITYLLNTLNNISRIYVVSFLNEVKEILVLINAGGTKSIQISAIDIDKYGSETEFTSQIPFETGTGYSNEGIFFYEPSNALIKSGLTANYAVKYGLKPFAKNSLYILSDLIFKDFFGRKFKVTARVQFSKSKVKEYLWLNQITQANVSKRDFSLSVTEIRKLFIIYDGGDDYLFFTTDSKNQKWMFHCKKI